MAKRLPFSIRYETRRPTEGLIYDHVPARVQAGFINVLYDLLLPDALFGEVYLGLDRSLAGAPADPDLDDWEELIRDLQWDELCDACEVIWEKLDQQERDRFTNKLNQLFSRNHFGFELRDGLMEKVGARVQEAAIAEARGILHDPDLSGPDEQYQKAIGFFNRRPEPDRENCVKEAVSAVEGVARVLLKDDSIILPDAMKQLRAGRGVHATLVKLIDSLYAYRGDAEGVAHALTGPKEVRPAEAEFVLGASASAIVYLARLFGRGVE